jgi:hypothetical protein
MSDELNPTQPLDDLMQALAVLARDYHLIVSHCAETGQWTKAITDLARLGEVAEAARDLAICDAHQRGRITVEDLARFIGRSKEYVGGLLRKAQKPSGTWSVHDATDAEIGWIAAPPYNRVEAISAATLVHGDRAVDVRALTHSQMAKHELAAQAQLSPPHVNA